MHFSEVGFQILRDKCEIPSVARVKFWKMVFLSPKKIKLWSFFMKVVRFQWFRINNKTFNFLTLKREGTIAPLAPPLGAPLIISKNKLEVGIWRGFSLVIGLEKWPFFAHLTFELNYGVEIWYVNLVRVLNAHFGAYDFSVPIHFFTPPALGKEVSCYFLRLFFQYLLPNSTRELKSSM